MMIWILYVEKKNGNTFYITLFFWARLHALFFMYVAPGWIIATSLRRHGNNAW